MRASQVAWVVKNSPDSAGDVRDAGLPLGREDPLEEAFLPGESHGQRSRAGYRESDATEATQHTPRVWTWHRIYRRQQINPRKSEVTFSRPHYSRSKAATWVNSIWSIESIPFENEIMTESKWLLVLTFLDLFQIFLFCIYDL